MLRLASLSCSPQPETQLDSRSFVKLFKDSQLMNKKLTTTDLDIIFSKVALLTRAYLRITCLKDVDRFPLS